MTTEPTEPTTDETSEAPKRARRRRSAAADAPEAVEAPEVSPSPESDDAEAPAPPVGTWRARVAMMTADGKYLIRAGEVFSAPEGDPRTRMADRVDGAPSGAPLDAGRASAFDDLA